MSELVSKTIAELRDGIRSREFTAREVAESYNAAVAAARLLNAYTVTTPDDALAAAEAADSGKATGPLAGIPLGIKDLFATKGVDSTAGSHILKGFKPTYESTVTANLRRAGAGMLGKLNMDEFAMGSSNETSAYGPVISPWRRKGSNVGLTPGGSSGGSAAAVAAGIAPGATGTDTGGSIRQPAAFAGICGIKPTYGRCSRWGIVAFASSLDQAGPMARSVRDCAILLEAMAGFDPKDSTSLDLPVPQWEANLSSDLSGKRVGIPKEYRIDGVPEDINSLWDRGIEWLRDAGAIPVEISLPHTKYALPTYYIIAPAEASSNLARYDGVRYGLRAGDGTLDDLYEQTRAAGFGAEVKRRIMLGTFALSAGYYEAYYGRAQRVRTKIADDFRDAFGRCDFVITPTSPTVAFKLGERTGDPLAMYLSDYCTVPMPLAGIPAISIPAGLARPADGGGPADGLPVGFQIAGPAFSENRMLDAAYALEQRIGFDTTRAFPA
ncbi:MAG: Asp-tRNA(Asn)/Glu-tRNA(Gln) amidotransferase subunit GatA [Sphingomicrobium sp.]